jgi:hypothetical protein
MNKKIATHIYKKGDTVKITQQGVLETGCIGTLNALSRANKSYWHIDGLDGLYTERQFELIITTQQPTKTITRGDIYAMIDLALSTSTDTTGTARQSLIEDIFNNVTNKYDNF